MKRLALLACAAALLPCTGAHAGTIPFFNAQYEATVVALSSDGPAGLDSRSGTLGPDLVSVSTDSIGTRDVATAGAIVGMGFLSTSADVSAGALSSATATARFIGSFVNGGPVSLDIAFTPSSFSDGSGGAATTLFVSLVSDGVQLFADYITDAWQFSYRSAYASTAVLDVTLTSEVSAAFLASGAGNAGSLGMVAITGTVPEAGTWLLSVLGLGVLAAVRRRTPQAARPA